MKLRGVKTPRQERENADKKPQETGFSSGMGLRESALALRAQSDERAREELITRQEKNILRVTSLAKRRFVTKSDDEWAIALCAFSHAIDTYRSEKGAFVPYAETLMKRSLIDAHRAEAKNAQEMLVSPDAFEGGTEEGESNPVLAVVMLKSIRAADTALRDEIIAANVALRHFGFGFYDLTSCSPGRESTRKACLLAAEAVLGNEDALAQLMRTRQLPVKRLITQHAVPEKLIERYRKYIIAMIVICTGDYPALQEYIRGRRGNR